MQVSEKRNEIWRQILKNMRNKVRSVASPPLQFSFQFENIFNDNLVF